jgi:hypothetical protein
MSMSHSAVAPLKRAVIVDVQGVLRFTQHCSWPVNGPECNCVVTKKGISHERIMTGTCEHKWVKNGRYRSKKRGSVQRWLCTVCGETRNDFEREPSTIKAFALLALGLGLDQTRSRSLGTMCMWGP